MLEATSKRLMSRINGKGDDSVIAHKKNAFRYPNDPDSEYPQQKKPIYIEKRSEYLPREYLIKNTGEKKKNRIKREQDEALKTGLLIAEGRENEGKAIEIDDMIIDKEEDKKISNEMNIDIDNGYKIRNSNIYKKKRNQRKGFRHKQRSKKLLSF